MRTVTLCAALLLGGASAHHVRARELTFEDRVAAQRAIEQVGWNHRIWPKENPGPKPPLAAVMSEEAIRAKVEDYLEKSNALERRWRRPVTSSQLQAELDRMARSTRAPAILLELFAALGNDPTLIAETLARQTLANRLIRNFYASDARVHGPLKRKVQSALASCGRVDCMVSMGGTYRETTFRLDEDAAAEPIDPQVVFLDATEWKELGEAAGSSPTLEERADALVVTAMLAQGAHEIRVATALWPKTTFDVWWAGEQRTTGNRIPATSMSFTLPPVQPRTACQEDFWRDTGGNVPSGREFHAAVWTGSEMIVWGGFTTVTGSSGDTIAGGRYDPTTDTWTATSTGANVPTGREFPTAVWTGTEMIVWGGHNAPSELNTGGRYDPSTDTWKATSTGANAPSGRYRHSAVWTGSEMIIWGGLDGSDLRVNSGGRYDPSTNTWAPTSMTNTPTGREVHTAVWTGTEMIVWGGRSTTSLYRNTGGRYNPVTDTWTTTSIGANVPGARGSHTAIWTGAEMIVWGGVTGSGVSRTGGRYSPSTDTWAPTSTGTNVPTARWSNSAVWTGSEMIIWGGDGGGGTTTYVNTGGRYSPSTDTWIPTSTGPHVPSKRWSHTTVWTGSEMIVWGGNQGGGGFQNTGGRYDPSTDTWAATSTAMTVPIVRRAHSAVWTGTEMIVWGGDHEFFGYLNSGGRYDPSTDTWTATSLGDNVPTARGYHSAVWTGTEMVVWGGHSTFPIAEFTNSGGRYDPATDTWKATSIGANVPEGRQRHTALWTGSEMIVWGGGVLLGVRHNTGGRYTPSTDTWTATSTGPNVPAGRYFHSVVWTGAEMIVWGGEDSASQGLNTGGRYDPSADTWTATSTGTNVPIARRLHSAVWTGSEMIVWGGRVGDFESTNTGGAYDPSSDLWTETSTGINVPVRRENHTAVWTGLEMIVWGGAVDGSSGGGNSGGRYRPSTDAWTATSTVAIVPVGRQSHTAVWTGSEMIVWGGAAGLNRQNTGGAYCACPQGGLAYRDADGDGYGDSGVPVPSCDGSIPPGFVLDGTDCNDTDASIRPGVVELCDGIDENCDGRVDEDGTGLDTDADSIANACDNCRLDFNTPQSDLDQDGEGDVCDLNDGLIWEWRITKTSVDWQAEQGPDSWNVYLGDLSVLRASAVYTQTPGSNALAARHCGVTSTSLGEPGVPALGNVSFSLVTGLTSGIEGSLGSSTSGPRPNANPCP